jgi:hypothetical protein
MPFEIPTLTFNALAHATDKVLRSNQLEKTILDQFKAAYEDFWGVSGTESIIDKITVFKSAGSRYSVEEMQSIINVLGATAISIMTAAGGLVQFIEIAYPGVLEDRYKSTAFEYAVGEGGITLTKLSDAWAITN